LVSREKEIMGNWGKIGKGVAILEEREKKVFPKEGKNIRCHERRNLQPSWSGCLKGKRGREEYAEKNNFRGSTQMGVFPPVGSY